jgi:hypothetical protein
LVSGDTISLDRDDKEDEKLKVTIKKAEESSEAS